MARALNGFPQPMRSQMEQKMPAVSKRQYAFMKGVAGGSIKKPGLSKSEAAEYVSGQSPKGLPSKARKRHKVKYPSPKR